MATNRAVLSYSDLDNFLSNTQTILTSDNEDDECFESLQTVALPVASSISNPALGPQTGEEYLFMVQQERRRLQTAVSSESFPQNTQLLSMDALIEMGFSF